MHTDGPRRCTHAGLVVLILVAGALAARPAAAAHADAIARENARPGTADWLLTRVAPSAANTRDERYERQRAIEGYVSHTSIRAGDTLTAFVSVDPADRYRVEIFRMGHYGGTGGRLVQTIGPLEGKPAPDPVDGAAAPGPSEPAATSASSSTAVRRRVRSGGSATSDSPAIICARVQRSAASSRRHASQVSTCARR